MGLSNPQPDTVEKVVVIEQPAPPQEVVFTAYVPPINSEDPVEYVPKTDWWSRVKGFFNKKVLKKELQPEEDSTVEVVPFVRGRTVPQEQIEEGGSSLLGTSVIRVNTLLTTRQLRPYEVKDHNCLHMRADHSSAIVDDMCQLCGTEYYEVIEGRRVEHDRVVTTAGVNAIVDAFQGTFTINDFKYHDAGTGVGAEAVGDTALGTAWGGARVSGTQVEGASANIYKSVATITFNNTFAITEHGLFSAAAAGTLLDRTVFAAINVGNNDSIQFTFEITFAAGS